MSVERRGEPASASWRSSPQMYEKRFDEYNRDTDNIYATGLRHLYYIYPKI
jgi:hypothetical protein